MDKANDLVYALSLDRKVPPQQIFAEILNAKWNRTQSDLLFS